MRGDSAGGLLLEHVGAVREHAPQTAVGDLRERQQQIAFRGLLSDVERGQADVSERLRWRGLQREHRLEDRGAVEIARRLQLVDQLFERHVLMRVGIERRAPDAPHELAERRLPAHVASQHQRVDEKSDQRFQLHTSPIRDRRAHRKDRLCRPPIQHCLPRRNQRHEQRDTLATTERPRARHDLGRNRERLRGAAPARHRRPQTIDRQFQRRYVRQRPTPMRNLRVQHRAAQPRALPRRVVGVLHRQRRKRRR